jgi:C4-dicarboxylate-specific signal transduction histidine kinase
MNPNKKLHLIETAIKAAEEFEQQGNIQESVDEYLHAAESLKTPKGNEADVANTLGEQHPLAKTISDNYFKLQNEVAELQQELIAAEKFKFLGQIMTQVAHNINNPLQIIHGNVTGALDDLNEGLFNAETELRPLLENLKQQTDRISNLIQDFRKLAQGDRKKLETVNLNELAEQAAERLHDQFLIHKIQLVIEPMQPAPLAHSNALVVTEAIINLLSNAKDALTGQKAAKVTLSTWEDAQNVGIKVEDNGKGIHPEQQSQLFHTLYPSQKTVGWGLGLYTSHHTLKSLGGKIVYTSQNQGGACFTIILKKASNHV